MTKELNFSKHRALARISILVSGLLFLSSEVFAFIHSSYSDTESLVQHIYDERNQKRVHTQYKPGNVAEITDHNYDLLDRLEKKTQRGHVVRSHLKNACAWHLGRRQCSESSCITYTLRFLRAGGSQSACARLIFEAASSYTYDNNGNRLSVTSPGGTTTNTFDTRNRLDTVTTASGVTEYTYLATGWTDIVTHANGTKVDYDYDSIGRPLKIINRAANDDVLSQFDYQYDLNGNRTQQIEIQNGFADAAERTRTTDYVYDDLDRLESFTHTQGASTESHTYAYYPSYDRKTETVVKDGATLKSRTFTYDETNWIKTITEAADTGGVITYTYDNNGNSTAKTDTTGEGLASTLFTYNSRNQLVGVAAGNTGSEVGKGAYHYNYQGMRIRHLGSARGDIEYVYDDKSIIDELGNSTTTQVAHYSYGDRLLSLTSGGAEQFYHYAALGTTANLTNTSGQNQIAYRLDPFGEITQQEGTSLNRQVFTGHEHDTETGLIYMKARFYDPAVGRFINQDTYLGESTTPPSLHRYLYAYGNPLVFVDPTGHAPFFGEQATIYQERGDFFRAEAIRHRSKGNYWRHAGLTGLQIVHNVGAGVTGAINYAWDSQMAAQAERYQREYGVTPTGDIVQSAVANTRRIDSAVIGTTKKLFGSPDERAELGAPLVVWGHKLAAGDLDASQSLLTGSVELITGSAIAKVKLKPKLTRESRTGPETGTNQANADVYSSAARNGEPSDPYDSDAWRDFYIANPHYQRSVGAQGVNEKPKLYRGVHAGHPAMEDAKRGIVKPAKPDANLTPEQHAKGGLTGESQYVSWTPNKNVALDHANKKGPGGLLLEVEPGKPSADDSWAWGWTNINDWGEVEMLQTGIRTGIKVNKVGNE